MTGVTEDDKIVISGMSGKCPNAMNLLSMKEQLYNKEDMITGDNSRFKNNPDVPNRFGVIPDITKFDNAFFGIPQREVDMMDPTNRLQLEIICEALIDAGINLTELENQKVGIYTGNCTSESEINCYHAPKETNSLLGCSRTFFFNRIGYTLKVSGQSFCADAACSSSLFAFQSAYDKLLKGEIDYGIICAHNLIITPNVSRQFFRLGVLSPDGKCKCFDAEANGYARSDAAFTIILQRASTAKRVYGEIMHCLTNCDGFKEMGITYPSTDAQKVLLDEFYAQCPISLDDIGYLEAHGTGTRVGDPVEMKTVEETFCKNRKDPLLVGSVKGNVGHSEGGSGLGSLVKLGMIMNTGLIPPNIHYHSPNPNIHGITNGKIKIVTETTPFPKDKPYAAISNFGFGGANGHIVIKQANNLEKQPHLDKPRLVCVSGRTYEAIETILNDLKSREYDVNYLALINAAFNTFIEKHDYRAFAIATKSGIQYADTVRQSEFSKPLLCFFHTNGSTKVVLEIMHFQCFDEHLNQVQHILSDNKITWDRSYLRNEQTNSLDNILTTVIVQTGIVKVLKQLNIQVEEYQGSGIGEVTAAYADNVLNLEQAILVSNCIRRLLQETQELNENILYTELHKICNTTSKPTKWKLDNKHGNIAEYLSTSLMQPRAPIVHKSNLLLVGGNSPHEENIVSLCDRNLENGIFYCIGKLFQLKYSTNLNALYSTQWPVRNDTPMLGHLIKWRHNKSWEWLVRREDHNDVIYTDICLSHLIWQNIDGHNIDGRILFPATGYLNVAWQTFSEHYDKPIVFEDIKFLRACTIPATGNLRLRLQICKKTGSFQFTEGGAIVVTGKIRFEDNIDEEWVDLPPIPLPEADEMMNKKDIYKELGLRGYYYQGQFKEIQNCNINATVGSIKWTDWIPFMDNMLQIKIMQEDTRSLYVPTKISKLTIDPSKHMEIIFADGSESKCDIPVYHYKDLDIIRCGFIEVRGLNASSIVKKKNPSPVLESNKFVPYVANLDIRSACRVMAQLALENSYTIKIKAVEYLESVPDGLEPILPYVQDAFNDQPLIQPEFILLTKSPIDLKSIEVMNKPPGSEIGNYIAIGNNLSQDQELRKTLVSSLKAGGFLISREMESNYNLVNDLTIMCEYTTPNERIVMMKVPDTLSLPAPINISSTGFEWLEPLKAARQQKQNLLLYSENEPLNGIMGLTNCLLRESGGEKIINVLIDDKAAPKFDANNIFYKQQLNKHMAINVFKNGTWGSYRHLVIKESDLITTTHGYVNNTVRGDVSSLRWIQGPLCIKDVFNDIREGETDVHVYVAALNFRDIVFATGKVTLDSICKNRKFHECLLGMEFSGRTTGGRRVMGIRDSTALANYVRVNNQFLWNVPDEWSMQEAATVPCVYATLIYGLLMRANLMKGESILIHSATGGIGLSAINIALHYKCNIFVTVGVDEKREYIKKNYTSIPDSHIGNSRNTSFYEMILKQTNGQGVDVIINSLADEKLQASVKCLKTGGRFIEIGKYDLNNDTPLSLELTKKDAEYHGVMLDNIMSSPNNLFKEISRLLYDGIKSGYIKPIPVTAFEHDELEKAFRYMTTGKHIGKVVVKVREEEAKRDAQPTLLKMNVMSKAYFNPNGTYVILGGLGGFGLEFADWMIIRGAKNVVLVSRRGVTNGYQRSRIALWESYGCQIKISSLDATTRSGCKALLEDAQELGPIMGVFNLAVVLRDAVIENQTEETFTESYNPKSQATMYLDELTRTMAPRLEHFVVFSSVSCGRGNAGQTNYGYSNSVMERICEKRHEEGLPGKAIQWGVIGDVGIVADFKEQNIEIVIGGTLHQRVANCLEVMDIFLLHEDPIMSSMVVAEKKSGKNDNDIVAVVMELMQIKDVKTVSHNSTFPELGMDSMMAVEIKQTLEREFDLFLSPQELRNMTITKMIELSSSGGEVKSVEENSTSHIQQLLSFIPDEETCNISVVKMKSELSPKSIYLIPGVEGTAKIFEPMVEKLAHNVICLQFPYNDSKETIHEYAKQKFDVLKKELTPGIPFTIAAHSLGVPVALETVTMLEDIGYTGTLYLLDGAPEYNKGLINVLTTTTTDDLHQVTMILEGALARFLPLQVREDLRETLTKATSFRERCSIAINAAPDKLGFSDEFLHSLMLSSYRRQKAELMHVFKPRTYQSRIVLCKASICSVPNSLEDYGLKSLVGENIEVIAFEGDHISILTNDQLIEFISNN